MTGRLRPTLGAAPAPVPDVKSLVDMLGARVFVDVVIPRTQIRGRMRLVTRSELFGIHAETRHALSEAGFPVDVSVHTAPGVGEQWQYELGVRVLAVAVRDPANEALQLAPVEEWRECDDDQIATLYREYSDLATRIDPLGKAALTEEQFAALTAAAKKKDVDLLMSFGSRTLASFIATSAERPASSPILTS